MQTNTRTQKMVLAALMMGIIMVSILFIRIPIPFTQGYVHPGDAMIFLSVLVLGLQYGAAAAALGGMLGDIIGGFAMWAPWTFAIKGIMAIIMGLIITEFTKKPDMSDNKKMVVEIIGMVVAGAFMVAGYYVAEGIMYGNWVSAALGIPWNIGQVIAGAILATILGKLLRNTASRKFFTYK